MDPKNIAMAGVGKLIKWFFFDPFILNRANLNAEPMGKIKPINTHGMNSTTELIGHQKFVISTNPVATTIKYVNNPNRKA